MRLREENEVLKDELSKAEAEIKEQKKNKESNKYILKKEISKLINKRNQFISLPEQLKAEINKIIDNI